MQKSLIYIPYVFHENHMYIRPYTYGDFEKSDMICLASFEYIYMDDCIKKISFDALLSNIKNKSLVIFVNNIFDSNQRHRLVETNKNIYFGGILQSDDRILITEHIQKYIPNDMSRFILLCDDYYDDCGPNVSYDLREFICLQNIHYCMIHIESASNCSPNIWQRYKERLQCVIHDQGEHDKFTFKLPYGCTVEILNNFDKLVC